MAERYVSTTKPSDRVCVTGALVVLFLLGSVLVARFALHGPVTGARLALSVVDQTGSPGQMFFEGVRPCTRIASLRWNCVVLQKGGSGDTPYVVTRRRGSSCWTARQSASQLDASMPTAASGCVRLLHF